MVSVKNDPESKNKIHDINGPRGDKKLNSLKKFVKDKPVSILRTACATAIGRLALQRYF